MAMHLLDALERIIWSADVEDEATLMGHLDRMPELQVVKIDRSFVEGKPFTVFHRLNERGLKVFDDAKIVEIPAKAVGRLTKIHLAHRPWMLNCMVEVQSTRLLRDEDPEKIDGLKRFADACLAAGTKPCVVTVLTSTTPETAARRFNGRSVIDQVLLYLEDLVACGVTDAVCSPLEAAAIRKERRFDKLSLNTPGIRPAGSAAGDQARADTPEAAIKAGSTRLVIGRPITKGDPAANLRAIAKSISTIQD